MTTAPWPATGTDSTCRHCGSYVTDQFGLASGLCWAATVALLELTAGTDYGERWRVLLEDVYPGYSRDPGDLAWGTAVGAADGFALAAYSSFKRDRRRDSLGGSPTER